MSGLSRILALAMAGLAAPSLQYPIARMNDRIVAPRRVPQRIPTRRYYGITFSYPNGPGWTVAQVKRMAKKARNQRRHRLACRGSA